MNIRLLVSIILGGVLIGVLPPILGLRIEGSGWAQVIYTSSLLLIGGIQGKIIFGGRK